MRRRLDLAASLVGTPKILFLDEPTTGLDPRSRGDVWAMVRELVAEGTTVLLTTQYLDEADRLANEIAVIDHGSVIASGTPAELKAKVGGQTLDVRPTDPADLAAVATIVAAAVGRPPARTPRTRACCRSPSTTRRRCRSSSRELQTDGIAVTELALRLASLDEVFLALTGHTAEERPSTTGGTEDHDRRDRGAPAPIPPAGSGPIRRCGTPARSPGGRSCGSSATRSNCSTSRCSRSSS